jgi:trimeric autotransporter adhesin
VANDQPYGDTLDSNGTGCQFCAGFNLTDSTGKAFNSSQLPTVLNLGSFDTHWIAIVNGTSPALGTITSIAGGASLLSLSVAPLNPSIPLGNTQQFMATAVYSDSTTHDVTASATWSSSNTGIATISASGLASSVTQGSATISATYGGQSASTTLTVGAPALVSIAVTPNSATVSAGSYVRFTATGTYTNGTTANISNTVTWLSTDNTVSTVDSTGLAHTVAAGAVTITASSGAAQGTATLTAQ